MSELAAHFTGKTFFIFLRPVSHTQCVEGLSVWLIQFLFLTLAQDFVLFPQLSKVAILLELSYYSMA